MAQRAHVAGALAALLIASAAGPAAARPCLGPASATQLAVRVDGVRSGKGLVTVTLYPDNQSRFLARDGSVLVARTPAQAGITRFCVNLPRPGTWAIALYHDEDGSKSFGRDGPMGVPTEGFGFSNNPRMVARLPSFWSVRLSVPRSGLETTIRLQYP